MLFSAAGRIAFAHYPKTAGASLTAWFRERFPDAVLVDPADRHLPVRPSLERLGQVNGLRSHPRLTRECLRIVRRVVPHRLARGERCDVRVIGVLREPLEMLVSLYEYWRRHEFATEPADPLVHTARTGSIHEFINAAVGRHPVATYESFFDVGGAAWDSTRLIDFQSLEPGLAEVCAEFGVGPPPTLRRINAAPRRECDIEDFMADAGSLVFQVRSHFRWYYREAGRLMIRGRRPSRLRAA